MIPIGTLCLLINGHELEGRTCVVVGPLEYDYVVDSQGRDCWDYVYDIDVDVVCPEGFKGWAAFPNELLPIAPPTTKVERFVYRADDYSEAMQELARKLEKLAASPMIEQSSGYEEYDALPPAIKQYMTVKEWLWLTDSQKATVMQDQTGPEWDE